MKSNGTRQATGSGRITESVGEVSRGQMRKAKARVGEGAAVTITAPNFQFATFEIVGTAPLVMHKFSAKTRRLLMDQQAAGSQSKSKKVRQPKDFDEVYENAKHISDDGWCGIPAPAFRCAMIDACRLVGFKMTHAKLSVFVEPDGFDADDGTPLVRIFGDPIKHEASVRNATGVVDIRVRPMWKKWSCNVVVKFDADQFSLEDVSNLMQRAGTQCGLCEGRPNSKASFGQGWGTFAIKE